MKKRYSVHISRMIDSAQRTGSILTASFARRARSMSVVYRSLGGQISDQNIAAKFCACAATRIVLVKDACSHRNLPTTVSRQGRVRMCWTAAARDSVAAVGEAVDGVSCRVSVADILEIKTHIPT